MPRLRVREVATQKGLNMSQLSRRADIAMGTVRRYWYSTSGGKADGAPLREIDMVVLQAIAHVLDVPIAALIEEDESNHGTPTFPPTPS